MKKHRAILIGCGGISNAWLGPISAHLGDRVEIVGLVDLNPETARKQAEKYGLGNVWTGASLDEALAALKPDVAFNLTIPEAHFATTKAALQAGCHVLTEKPLTPTVAEARELVALSEAVGKTFAVIQNRRYLSGEVAVRRAIAGGIIGPVHSVYADFFLGPHFGGFREEMRHVLLLDMAIHTFDQGRHLTGLDPVRASAFEFNPAGSWFSHGASAIVTFEMTGGAVFNYRGSWCAQGLPTSWECDWRVIGGLGTLRWGGGKSYEVERLVGPHRPGDFFPAMERLRVEAPDLPESEHAHCGNIAEFLNALDGGPAPQTAAADNVLSLAMVEAATNSAESGLTVNI